MNPGQAREFMPSMHNTDFLCLSLEIIQEVCHCERRAV